jgi:uroporphyrinogen III methyltransferase/synthase
MSAAAAGPLAGKRVLLARAEGQGDGAARLLVARGAEPVVIPSLAIGPPDDVEALREALSPAALEGVAWVVFTSANGVERTWQALAAGGRGGEAFGAARLAAIGPATRSALEARGAVAHAVPKEFRGEGMAASLLEAMGSGAAAAAGAAGGACAGRVLLLRAQEARDVLPDTLRAHGVPVTVVAVYRTRPDLEGAARIAARLAERSLDVVVFASGSTVDAICEPLGDTAAAALAPVTVACIGPVTASAAAARGLRVDVVPEEATFAAAVDALEAHFQAI